MRIQQGTPEGEVLIEMISGLLSRRKIKAHPSRMMRGSILVALDGSAASQSAARMAIRISQVYNYIIHGLFVVDSRLITNPYARYQNELVGRKEVTSRSDLLTLFQEEGNQVLNRLEADCGQTGVSVFTELVFGGVPEIINQKAKESTLLAIGKRGRGHLNETHYLGHQFREIIHSVGNFILLGDEELHQIHQILFPTRIKKAFKVRSHPYPWWRVLLSVKARLVFFSLSVNHQKRSFLRHFTKM